MSVEPASIRDRIVVGVDGSPPSQQALRWARFLAHVTGSAMEAVAVWHPLATYGFTGAKWAAFPGDWNPLEDARRVLLDTIDEALGEQQPPGLHTTVHEGTPARVLLEVSRDARMLVVGSRGHGGFAGLLLGSVSAAVAEHATCPVFVIHGSTPPPP